jgi:hypothetical protein
MKQYIVCRWTISNVFQYKLFDMKNKSDKKLIFGLRKDHEVDIGLETNNCEEAIKKMEKLNKVRNLLK